MHKRRTVPASNRPRLGGAFSHHALTQSRASSSLHRFEPTNSTGDDPDLAELKSSWSWNFAGAPRTDEQEEKHWFNPSFTVPARSRGKHRAGAVSCARCGKALRIEELISHQSECLGERDGSSDEESSAAKPRWRGPLDKEPVRKIRRPALPDFADFDLDPMDFLFFGPGAGRRGSNLHGAGPKDDPPYTSTWSHGPSRSSAGSSSSSYSAKQESWRPPNFSKAPPPKKPPSPPPRPAPSPSQAPAAPSAAALDNALATHEKSWSHFETSQAANIRYADIPWPDHTKSSADSLLVQHALRKAVEAGDVKAALRKLQLRWHPDKWSQKFVSKLGASDADRIMARVKEIAQIVNGLKASS